MMNSDWFGRLRGALLTFGPARTAFIGSLILSAIAIAFAVGPNRDGMLYVDTAQIFLEHGWGAARANFDWPFLAVLIALASQFSGLSPAAAGFLIGALLMAGVCSTLVLITRRSFPDAAWAACVVVLALPALNGYRDHIIREFGFWFFALSALLVAMRWDEHPRRRDALLVHALIAVATLFRLEAIALYPGLLGWQLFRTGAPGWTRRVAMLGVVPFFGLAAGVALLAGSPAASHERVVYYLTAANPMLAVERFSVAAHGFAASVLNRYSADEAGSILFFGLMSIIPVKFLQASGVFAVPLGFAVFSRSGVRRAQGWLLLVWVFAAYVAVLFVFLMHQFFLTGRYVSFLNLLAVPLIAAGCVLMLKRFERWRLGLLLVAVIVALANVTSTGPRKTQYREAGEWLASQAISPERVYIEDGRIAYFANWRMAPVRSATTDRSQLAREVQSGRFDLVLLDVRRKDVQFNDWVAALPLTEVAHFTNSGGDAVVALKPQK